MPHFIVEVTYKVPLTRIDELIVDHRNFLQQGYDRGILLSSGPQVPRTGGLLVARAASREELDTYLAADPFNTAGAADYRVIEYAPNRYQPLLKDWIEDSQSR